MSHPFGDLLSQHLHRKHGLSQSKLAAGIQQAPSTITLMCKGGRLTGPQARERVLAIVGWLHAQATLETAGEADALLVAAGMAPLRESNPQEAALLRQLRGSTHPNLPARAAPAQPSNLPVFYTPFIGRAQELAMIERHLADPRCHLLTLAGPGGVGKTRLAIEAASARSQAYADAAHFVNLQPVQASDALPHAIADALHMVLSGSAAPLQQLQNHLANKHLLLLLDNFEHLLGAGATVIADLLASAPNVQVLITSREVLNLREEWQCRVEGIGYPPNGPAETGNDLLRYDAVRLFVECAYRIQPAFSLDHEAVAVAQICRLAEGLPLAIELAAAWIRILPCADIAQELDRGLAILSSKLRNAPLRHSSMQAVFDHSWRMLNAHEREAFSRLAVFRAGFTRDAAAKVAGATMDTLFALVDKSLLRSTPNGRYQIHELLRQYGEERLAESPEDLLQTQQRHCRYYTDLLSLHSQSLAAGNQLPALEVCMPELDNVRVAWRWTVDHCDVAALQKAAAALYWICQLQSHNLEGVDTLASAAERLTKEAESPGVTSALVEVLPYLAWLAMRLGRVAQSEAAAIQCLELERRHDILPQPGNGNGPLCILSVISAIRGDYLQAEKLASEEYEFSQAHGQVGNLPSARWALANAALAQGKITLARQAALEAVSLCQQYQTGWFMAYCLNTLGTIAVAEGDLDAAKHCYWDAYRLRQEFGDPEGMAVALNNLGEIALAESEYEAARQHYEDSLTLYQDLNDRGGSATALKGLGDVACQQQQRPLAEQHYQKALQVALDINYVPLLLNLLLAIAGLFFQTDRLAAGSSLLALVLHHPGSDHASKADARQMLDRQGVQARSVPLPVETNWQAALAAECEMVIHLLDASPEHCEPITTNPKGRA